MQEQDSGRTGLRKKAVSEFKELAALSAYLYVCLGAVVLLKSAVLQQAGVSYTIWGIAAIKALVLAKFMLVGRALNLGKRFGDKPLIWPTLYHAFIFLILLLVLTTLEELFVGLLHHRPLADSLTHVVGSTFLQAFAVCLVIYLILIPYSAFMCLGEVFGEHEVARLFFVSRSPDPSIRERPA
jgi:multidrug transporter EmrE-like cation transporter